MGFYYLKKMEMKDDIILVDKNDNEIGTGKKMEVHKSGKLHRAFSILVFNPKGELMLQKRSRGKYHCGGLWTNTCCSHPRPGEKLGQATHRRLVEEMGFDCGLQEVFSFVYKARFSNELTEHEFDHVFVGEYEDEPKLNPEEAEDWRWGKMDEVAKDIENNPEKYTFWFREILKKYQENN